MSAFFFFFQAEDGIRDATVTGVQTCALPIFATRFEVPQLAELAEDPPADFLDHGSDVRVRRWLAWHKTWLEALVRTIEIDALKEDHMKMEIEIEGTAKTLHKRDRPRLDVSPR